jgi:hypothetical protein
MSERYPTMVESQELSVACPKCQAEPYKWCTRWEKTGKGPGQYQTTVRVMARDLHTDRFRAATDAGRLPLPGGVI